MSADTSTSETSRATPAVDAVPIDAAKPSTLLVARFVEMPRKQKWILGIAALVVVVVAALPSGNAKSELAAGAFSANGSLDTHWIDAQIAAWDEADLSPGGFATVDPTVFGAAECRGGAAGAVEVTLCEFETAAAAAAATAKAEKSIGKNTGVVLAGGDRLLVLVDRRSADPAGRTINRLAQTFVR